MIHEDEWSGFLFFQIEGDLFEDPANVVIRAKDIYLQDMGTKAHTQFTNMGEDIVEMYNKHPEWMKCRMGLIHSHNSMPVFFSGEDVSELKDNCPGTDFYFSLIVNNRGEFCAKAAWMESHKVEAIKTVSFRNSKQEIIQKKENNDYVQHIMKTVDFDIYLEDGMSEIVERMIVIKKKGLIDGRSTAKERGPYFSESGPSYGEKWNRFDDEKEVAKYLGHGRKMDEEKVFKGFERPKWMDKTVDPKRQLSLPGIEMTAMDMDISRLCAKIVMVDEDFRGTLPMAIADYDHVIKKMDIEEYSEMIFTNMPFIHLRLFSTDMSSTVIFNVLTYISTMKETNKFSKHLIKEAKAELARKFKSVSKATA